MQGSYLGFGKRICEVLINGVWRHLPVDVLVDYRRRDELLYRCHSCKKEIVLHRQSRNQTKAAHFEHKPFNRNCPLRFAYNEEFREDKPLTTITAKKIHKDASFEHFSLLIHAIDFSESDRLTADIEELKMRRNLSRTQYQTLVDARCGQGQYRQSLIELWKGCAVTGAKDINMLKASHIVPWSKSTDRQRLDKFNGFLLSPNLDVAFDRHLISFNDEGRILISRSFKDYKDFNIDKRMNIKLFAENLRYLKEHRQEFESIETSFLHSV